jgi:hypothetical protein
VDDAHREGVRAPSASPPLTSEVPPLALSAPCPSEGCRWRCLIIFSAYAAPWSSRYAKYFGSYGAIEGGLVHLALVDLTGGSSELVKLDGEVARQEIKSGHMWSKVLMYYRSGYLLGAGSNAGRDTVRWASCIRGVGLVRTAKQRSWWCVPVWHSGDHGAGYRSWPRVRGVAS